MRIWLAVGNVPVQPFYRLDGRLLSLGGRDTRFDPPREIHKDRVTAGRLKKNVTAFSLELVIALRLSLVEKPHRLRRRRGPRDRAE